MSDYTIESGKSSRAGTRSPSPVERITLTSWDKSCCLLGKGTLDSGTEYKVFVTAKGFYHFQSGNERVPKDKRVQLVRAVIARAGLPAAPAPVRRSAPAAAQSQPTAARSSRPSSIATSASSSKTGSYSKAVLPLIGKAPSGPAAQAIRRSIVPDSKFIGILPEYRFTRLERTYSTHHFGYAVLCWKLIRSLELDYVTFEGLGISSRALAHYFVQVLWMKLSVFTKDGEGSPMSITNVLKVTGMKSVPFPKMLGDYLLALGNSTHGRFTDKVDVPDNVLPTHGRKGKHSGLPVYSDTVFAHVQTYPYPGTTYLMGTSDDQMTYFRQLEFVRFNLDGPPFAAHSMDISELCLNVAEFRRVAHTLTRAAKLFDIVDIEAFSVNGSPATSVVIKGDVEGKHRSMIDESELPVDELGTAAAYQFRYVLADKKAHDSGFNDLYVGTPSYAVHPYNVPDGISVDIRDLGSVQTELIRTYMVIR